MIGKLFSLPMLGLLAIYRWFLSPVTSYFGVKCRHMPSCSKYAQISIRRHGPWAGGWLTLARLLRCHPFERLGGTSGVDNVPENLRTAPIWAPWRVALWRGTNSGPNT
jgi:putative membrane protein insertion efficiency factor